MPNKDPQKRREAWYRWYQANKDKHNQHVRASEKKRRIRTKQWIDSIKSLSGCLDCGDERFQVLEFHHISGDKEFSIATSIRSGFSQEKIQREIDKCIVLCANCHRMRHYNENDLIV